MILHEIYFGKTKEIKLVEKLLDLYVNYCKTGKLQKDLSEYDIEFLPYNKIKSYNDTKSERKYDSFLYNKYYDVNDTNKNLQKLLNLIGKYIEIIFGFIYVKVTPGVYTQWGNSSYGAVGTLQNNSNTIKMNKESKLIFTDDLGKTLNYKDVKNAIIVTDTGVFIDTKKLAIGIELHLAFKDLVQKYDLTGGELMAITLHELGHQFSKLLSNRVYNYHLQILDKNYYKKPRDEQNKIFKNFKRSDEIFADKFISLYGYSKEHFSVLRKVISNVEYNRNVYPREITKILKSSKIEKTPILRSIDKEHSKDVHPQEYTRLLYLIHHLKIEQKDPNISEIKRNEITKEIKILNKELEKYKYYPTIISYEKLSDKDKEVLKDYYKKEFSDQIITNLSLDKEDRKYQKQANIDSREYKAIFDNLYKRKDNANIKYTDIQELKNINYYKSPSRESIFNNKFFYKLLECIIINDNEKNVLFISNQLIKFIFQYQIKYIKNFDNNILNILQEDIIKTCKWGISIYIKENEIFINNISNNKDKISYIIKGLFNDKFRFFTDYCNTSIYKLWERAEHKANIKKYGYGYEKKIAYK